jgi:hypothetical protein
MTFDQTATATRALPESVANIGGVSPAFTGDTPLCHNFNGPCNPHCVAQHGAIAQRSVDRRIRLRPR